MLLREISTNRSISPCLLNSLITKSTYPDIDNGERAAITWCEQPRREGSIAQLAVGKDRLCIAVFFFRRDKGTTQSPKELSDEGE